MDAVNDGPDTDDIQGQREALLAQFCDLEEKWKVDSSIEGFQNTLNMFQIETEDQLLPHHVHEYFKSDWSRFVDLRMQLEDLNLEDDSENSMDLVRRFNEFINAICYSKECVLLFLQATNAHGCFPPPMGTEVLFHFSPLKIDDLQPIHVLVLYLLGELYKRRWRRYDGQVYEQVYKDTRPTHAWEEVASISDMVKTLCDKESHFDKWKLMTQGQNMQLCAKYLESCCDMEFPELHKSRHVWSFRDGIYDAARDEFLPYGHDTDASLVSCKLIDQDFLPAYYDDDDFAADGIRRKLTSGEISTPVFDSIMEAQGWNWSVRWWMYVFIGRLFYEVNEKDQWQVIPFLKGWAGTGKSTIIKVVEKFYQHRDVAVLSNNIERKFGLATIYDKLIFTCAEIKGDFALDQAQFQSMVTGEYVSVPIKHQAAVSTKWKVPGILAGNEPANWSDNSGSISRRVVIFPFAKKIVDQKLNPFLVEDIERLELAKVLRKCNIAYLQAVTLYKDCDIWTKLDETMKAEKRKLQHSSNALFAFLHSDQVIIEQNTYECEKNFLTALTEFARARFKDSQSNFSWGPDYYEQVLNLERIEVKTTTLPWPPTAEGREVSPVVQQTYILGCHLHNG